MARKLPAEAAPVSGRLDAPVRFEQLDVGVAAAVVDLLRRSSYVDTGIPGCVTAGSRL